MLGHQTAPLLRDYTATYVQSACQQAVYADLTGNGQVGCFSTVTKL
jgi:hypothetical protein